MNTKVHDMKLYLNRMLINLSMNIAYGGKESAVESSRMSQERHDH